MGHKDISKNYVVLFSDQMLASLLDSTESIHSLIPLPPHVNAERIQDSIEAANRPLEELDYITGDPLVEHHLNYKSDSQETDH